MLKKHCALLKKYSLFAMIRTLSAIKKVALICGVILALIFCTGQKANAQTKIVLNGKIDSLRILWHHDWKDTTGAFEQVRKFVLYRSVNNGAYLPVDSLYDVKGIGRPDTTYTFKNLVSNLKYRFGVVAVDYADNRSIMHTSSDGTAMFGGWYLSMDDIPPSKSYGISPQ